MNSWLRIESICSRKYLSPLYVAMQTEISVRSTPPLFLEIRVGICVLMMVSPVVLFFVIVNSVPLPADADRR